MPFGSPSGISDPVARTHRSPPVRTAAAGFLQLPQNPNDVLQNLEFRIFPLYSFKEFRKFRILEFRYSAVTFKEIQNFEFQKFNNHQHLLLKDSGSPMEFQSEF